MSRPKLYNVSDGESLSLNKKGELFACCDCGLVHLVTFQTPKGWKNKIRMRTWRDQKTTDQLRKLKKYPKN